MFHSAGTGPAHSACIRGLQSYPVSVRGYRRVVSASQPGEVDSVSPGEEPLLRIHVRRPSFQEGIVPERIYPLPGEVRVDAPSERLPVLGWG